MVSWQERRDIAGLRGELESLRAALGATNQDEALDVVRRLRHKVTELDQRVANLEFAVAALNGAVTIPVGLPDSGAATDALAIAASAPLSDSGTATDSIAITIS